MGNKPKQTLTTASDVVVGDYVRGMGIVTDVQARGDMRTIVAEERTLSFDGDDDIIVLNRHWDNNEQRLELAMERLEAVVIDLLERLDEADFGAIPEDVRRAASTVWMTLALPAPAMHFEIDPFDNG